MGDEVHASGGIGAERDPVGFQLAGQPLGDECFERHTPRVVAEVDDVVAGANEPLFHPPERPRRETEAVQEHDCIRRCNTG